MGLLDNSSTTTTTDNNKMSVNNGITGFGINLLRMGVQGAQNGVVAIYSVASVLGMTLLGANDNTALEIKNALTKSSSGSTTGLTTTSQDCDMDVEDEVDGCLIGEKPSTHFNSNSAEAPLSGSDDENAVDLHPATRSKSSTKTNRLQKVKMMMRRASSKTEKTEKYPFTVVDEAFHHQLASLCINTHQDEFLINGEKSEGRGYILRNANKLYVRKSGSVSKGFIYATESIYKTKPEIINFGTNPESCRLDINSWVDKHTESRIQNLLPQGSVGTSTSIIIVNAIYFKGEWENKFDPSLTSQRAFYPIEGAETLTDFMYKSDMFLHKSQPDLKCQVLELPYASQDLSFLVILPDDNKDFMSLQQQLNPQMINALTTNLSLEDTLVYLPKFKIEVGLDLTQVLMSLGMKDLFTQGKACLTGIDHKGELHVSGVMHKAFIEVNEEGSEAAGATAEVVRAASTPRHRPVFKADHPFFFMIRDNRTRAFLFMGQYCKP